MKGILTPAHVRKALCVLLSFAMLTMMGAGIAAAAPANLAIPVGGTFSGGTFVGTFHLQRFAVVNDAIVAVGTLTGTLANTLGNSLGAVVRTISMPLNNPQASCEILHLELGPVDLNLLGLLVHLDRITFDITAQPGAGNLLGTLLCAVANLLDGGGTPNQIVNVLNQILGLI